ncbi:Aspercryptin biosynthesis cluster D [Hyphodiscus hymeniophilus]|uniref:Aspercryptin biosynthesis cluster D n=1 Tax=Hyphodiscus hymeniophilus TaxID=353542 RepID=A0A9P7AYE7_9HELO|nr:Aspercryptin biosynthesis cluster D [Hyphodiscus hymeniophilus]
MSLFKEVLKFCRSHWTSLPYPTHKFTGQTIIVTGSNVGMGLEAARHCMSDSISISLLFPFLFLSCHHSGLLPLQKIDFLLVVRLEAAKVILAVRSVSKGEAAKSSIESSENRPGTVEVWELDLCSYASVKAFATRAQSLPRLDAVVENAGMYAFDFQMAEGDEATITVNVVSQFLLGLSLLPKLRETSVREHKECVLTFTGSFVHFLTKFPERTEKHVFEALAKPEGARMWDRYNVSKMIELLCMRELASDITSSNKQGNVVVSLINPGSVRTDIMRHAGYFYTLYVRAVKLILSRSAEEGGRTLVFAAQGGSETHGAYLDDCNVGYVSPFVDSDEGAETQRKVWGELKEKLERIQPGITKDI